jgi:hypothetical protein
MLTVDGISSGRCSKVASNLMHSDLNDIGTVIEERRSKARLKNCREIVRKRKKPKC